MTGKLYGEWIKNWDHELGGKGHKVILLQDNCPGRIVPDGLQKIIIIEPNLTAHVQPNDQSIIHCFKGHYQAPYILQAIEHYDSGVMSAEAEMYDNFRLCSLQTQLGKRLML